MKKIFFYFFILPGLCIAQTKQITNQPLNIVDPGIQSYMDTKYNMYVADYRPSNGGNSLTIKYGQKAFIGNEQFLYFKYKLADDSAKAPIIQSLEIYGSVDYVTTFFQRYWPTPSNRENADVFKLFQQDKIMIRNQSGKLNTPHIYVMKNN
jgi:hypothetical protein